MFMLILVGTFVRAWKGWGDVGYLTRLRLGPSSSVAELVG